MSLCCPPTDTSELKVYCLCTKFASFSCAVPPIKITARLMVADTCDPPRMEDGSLVLPFSETFWPGQCVKLPATTGTNAAEYINGSGYYEITVWDLNTNAILFGPAHVDISADGDTEECIDITNLLAAC